MSNYSYARTQRSLNEQIDVDQLDELISNGNSMARERKLSEITNALRYVAKFFSFVNEDKISFIADRLLSQNYSFRAIKTTFDSLPERFDKFPSYKDLTSLIRLNEPTKVQSQTVDEISDMHHRKLIGLRNMWLSKYTTEQLNKYCAWYYESIIGVEVDQLKAMIKSNIWEMNPLFDWYDNFYRLDKKEIEKLYKLKDDYRIKNKDKQYPLVNKNNEWQKYI